MFILAAFVGFAGFVWLVLALLGDNINYFKTPSLITLAERQEARPMRLGGIIEMGSISRHGSDIAFFVSDGSVREKIHFKGVVPDLFREGQGVVIDGHFGADGIFIASRVLAKHDENYMSIAPTRPFSLIDE